MDNEFYGRSRDNFRGKTGFWIRARGHPAAENARTDENTPKQLPPYKVLLHNDDVNEFGYVIETIVELTPIKRPQAIEKTFEADRKGLVLLLVTHKERAELYQEQFKSKRLTVTIEPD